MRTKLGSQVLKVTKYISVRARGDTGFYLPIIMEIEISL